MLELDTLFANEGAGTVPTLPAKEKQPESPTTQGNDAVLGGGNAPEVGHSGHNGNAPVLGEVCPRNPLQHKAFDELGTVGTVGTVALQGGDTKTGYRAPGGGADRNEFALHPAAVILLIAYCRAKKIEPVEQAEAIINLGNLPPGEQVRHWHTACANIGVKPWEVLLIAAPTSGLDCTMCKHLTTRQGIGGERRRFDWACGLGYLILETGRATERIWIAPPECSSWERWYPSDQR